MGIFAVNKLFDYFAQERTRLHLTYTFDYFLIAVMNFCVVFQHNIYIAYYDCQ